MDTNNEATKVRIREALMKAGRIGGLSHSLYWKFMANTIRLCKKAHHPLIDEDRKTKVGADVTTEVLVT